MKSVPSVVTTAVSERDRPSEMELIGGGPSGVALETYAELFSEFPALSRGVNNIYRRDFIRK